VFPELAELLAALSDAVVALDEGDRIKTGEAVARVKAASAALALATGG
jgi:hypothetical protein